MPFKILKKKFKNNKKVKIFNYALSDRSTNKILNINNKLTSTSSMEIVNEKIYILELKNIDFITRDTLKKKLK